MRLSVVNHNSLHNKLQCLRMLNLKQKAPLESSLAFSPHLSSSLFRSDPLGCVANSHLTQLRASLTDCYSQAKARHKVKRLYAGAQPNAHQGVCVWTAIRVVVSEVESQRRNARESTKSAPFVFTLPCQYCWERLREFGFWMWGKTGRRQR